MRAPSSGGKSQLTPAGLEVCAGRPLVLYVSSIEPRKNHRMLIEAWRRLIEARGRIRAKVALRGTSRHGWSTIDR